MKYLKNIVAGWSIAKLKPQSPSVSSAVISNQKKFLKLG